MRLLLVGAFPYPQHHGSQIYFQEQAIALRARGAEISLLTYGAGKTPRAENTPHPPDGSGPEADDARWIGARAGEYWRAIDGFDLLTTPKWMAPSSIRSGPSPGKPLADFGLVMTLRNAVASMSRHAAFDAILTHNAEATGATLAALRMLRVPKPPVVYCVHTLLGKELSAYLRGPKTNGFLDRLGLTRATGRPTRSLDRFGREIDQWLARRSDGWISLTRSSNRVMRQFSKRPGTMIPPALPDPLAGETALDPVRTARQHGLEPGRFFLYSGNLDAYQELDILAAAVRERRGGSRGMGGGMPVVLASHSPRSVAGWAEAMPGVDFRLVESAAEMQALLAAARASLLMRRAEGGFPIKLVNSLAVGTPAIAFHEGEWGLEHERNSLICSPDQPVESMAAAIDRLEHDDVLAARLAAGARALYLENHQPEPAAKQVLDLVHEIRHFHAGRGVDSGVDSG